MMKTAIAAAAALLGLAASPAPAQEDARDLARISNYLNATETLQGRFVQVDHDAVVSEGAFYMRRPGRMRFQYDPPNPALVIADGVWVGVVDQRDGHADRYPLRETPLHLLLRDNVDLRAEGAVTDIDRSGGQLAVTAVDPANPGLGQITMIFDNNPLALRQWVVVDAEGRTTTVALRDLRANVAIPADRFVIRDPR
ncbi:MAG: outer membrane lipoprotein carrier protein LolA [Rhodobacteraceae bacterium]|nr:MAG: outer membrane lipoprotein carrier protein LolA [Paracoccaceae bacterium]